MAFKLSLPQITVAAALFIAAQGCLLAAPGIAQTTGVSHPEDLPNDVTSPPADPNQSNASPTTPAPTASDHYIPPSHRLSSNSAAEADQVAPAPAATGHYAKPSPYIPADGMAVGDQAASAPTATSRYARPSDASPADGMVVGDETASTPAPVPMLSVRTPIAAPGSSASNPMAVTDDINSGIVTEVPVGPNTLPTGTVLRAELQNPISTADTPAGSRFVATLTADVARNNVVLLPAGTLIMGRVSSIHGGHTISGPAAIRLQPETVSLPDGTTYRVDAEVIDLDHAADSHVNSEGVIVDNTHPKATLGALGLATSAGAVAGAVAGGGVGAVVGASIAAGVGTVWWLKRDRQETLPSGTSIVFGLDNSLQLTPASR